MASGSSANSSALQPIESGQMHNNVRPTRPPSVAVQALICGLLARQIKGSLSRVVARSIDLGVGRGLAVRRRHPLRAGF